MLSAGRSAPLPAMPPAALPTKLLERLLGVPGLCRAVLLLVPLPTALTAAADVPDGLRGDSWLGLLRLAL